MQVFEFHFPDCFFVCWKCLGPHVSFSREGANVCKCRSGHQVAAARHKRFFLREAPGARPGAMGGNGCGMNACLRSCPCFCASAASTQQL